MRRLARIRAGGVGAVLLDEFHERHLARRSRPGAGAAAAADPRPELRIAAMSATLEADPVAAYLADCPILRAEGRRFEVTVEHAARPRDRPLENEVARRCASF